MKKLIENSKSEKHLQLYMYLWIHIFNMKIALSVSDKNGPQRPFLNGQQT